MREAGSCPRTVPAYRCESVERDQRERSVIDIRLMRRPSLVRKSRRAEKRRRRGCFGVEALEGRTLLSLTLHTHPIPETAGFMVDQIVPGPDGNLWFTAD